MKASDVTEEMVKRVEEIADAMVEMMTTNAGEDHTYVRWENDTPKEIIAAAVNAVLLDETPIHGEWLLANEYKRIEDWLYRHPLEDSLTVYIDFQGGKPLPAVVSLGPLTFTDTKTVGQLLALQHGLGLE